MDIEEATHEHGGTARVYSYRAHYDVNGSDIVWSADIRQGEEPWQKIDGTIPLTAPGVAALAEQAVRDAVVAQIDALEGT